jgi:hypothetical protein
MHKYHKINAPFKRDGEGKPRHGDFSRRDFENYQNFPWDGWEKLDGMNIRIWKQDGALGFGGKTDKAVLSAGLVDHLRREWGEIADFLLEDGDTLFGEGIGPKIQHGGGYCSSPRFIPFDLQRANGTWENRFVLQETIELELGMPFASYLGQHSLATWEDFCRERTFSETGVPGASADKTSEGYILIPRGGPLNFRGERVITKVKFCDYQ